MNELQRTFLNNRQEKFTITRIQRTEAISFSELPTKPKTDNRYRILVTLMRSDRPRYWNYLCSNCGAKVVELQNLEVYTIDDFYDPQNINNAAVGRHCTGDDRRCPYTYFFKVY